MEALRKKRKELELELAKVIAEIRKEMNGDLEDIIQILKEKKVKSFHDILSRNRIGLEFTDLTYCEIEFEMPYRRCWAPNWEGWNQKILHIYLGTDYY